MKQVSAKIPKACDGLRLDQACVTLFPELSRKKVKAIIDNGGAFVNRKRVDRAGLLVAVGQKLELFWEGDAQGPQRAMFDINTGLLFEHEGFLVVNKPAGIPAQATLTSSTDTILHAVAAASAGRFPVESLFLVHRLDKETSGIMLIARSKLWQQRIEGLFRERKIHKEYHALCFGIPQKPEGTILYPLEPDRSRKNAWKAVFSQKNLSREAKSAETNYTVLEELLGWDASYVLCKPRTGRTHQLRVHLQAIGCPIIGDKTYAQSVLGHPLGQTALRHLLHASRLTLTLPGLGEQSFSAPFPEDFQACLEKLRKS